MKTTIKLRKAKRKDFLEFDKYKKDGKTKKYKLKVGVPYWLINSKGKLEKYIYRTTNEMDMKSFGDYLIREQVFINKSKYGK